MGIDNRYYRHYYHMLGVEVGASDKEIKQAFRERAIIRHPDRSNHPAALETFNEIVTAYRALRDLNKRNNYGGPSHVDDDSDEVTHQNQLPKCKNCQREVSEDEDTCPHCKVVFSSGKQSDEGQGEPLQIFDNLGPDSELLPALQESLAHSSRADICTGYFHFSGWEILAPHVDSWEPRGGPCRVLIGMQSMAELDEQLTNGVRSNTDKETLLKLAEQLRAKRVLIKLSPDRVHAKFFILFPNDPSRQAVVYMGSSNLTGKGLSGNVELNVATRDPYTVRGREKMFEALWNNEDCFDITNQLVKIIDNRWGIQVSTPIHNHRRSSTGGEINRLPSQKQQANCRKCGREISDDTPACPSCEVHIEEPEKPPQNNRTYNSHSTVSPVERRMPPSELKEHSNYNLDPTASPKQQRKCMECNWQVMVFEDAQWCPRCGTTFNEPKVVPNAPLRENFYPTANDPSVELETPAETSYRPSIGCAAIVVLITILAAIARSCA